jgi:hypothetical protein
VLSLTTSIRVRTGLTATAAAPGGDGQPLPSSSSR